MTAVEFHLRLTEGFKHIGTEAFKWAMAMRRLSVEVTGTADTMRRLWLALGGGIRVADRPRSWSKWERHAAALAALSACAMLAAVR